MPDDRPRDRDRLHAITTDELEFLLDLLADRKEHGRASQEGRSD